MKIQSAIILALTGALLLFGNIATQAADELPIRTSPRPQTTAGVPHVQIGVVPVPALNKELLRRVALLPDVDVRGTIISLPGAKGFWLNNALPLAHPEIIISGREFAHVHPDGSLHASLPTPLALEAINDGWAIQHPWSKQRAGWDGFVMIYSPTTEAELDVVTEILVKSYNFITGRNLVIQASN